ncbi:hypothetical protein [Sphingomonas lenta]|uniref:DUF2157 domain-containing protein n=1 Tax=Sphingomonas lenta TaxID=1141887 RepID=A0A2A2SH37_9SPHN|nr:hypothetical protein [Sphingomonas lenta]PAX08577.1 hypothetical protein CKY28_04165 [Sphingomonas lenta]
MYSESDIDDAIVAGELSAEAAWRFRRFVASRRATPAVEEEQVRLLSGFNDIFISIAIALSLAAVAGIGGAVSFMLAGALVAGASWLLAEHFTARRKAALPSVLLALAFVGGAAATCAGLVGQIEANLSPRGAALAGAGVALAAAAAAWTHWRRFAVPIAVAAGALASVAVALCLVLAVAPAAERAIQPLLLAAGLALFLLAMRWDLSDRERRTRRADVAFWLHLAAAPLIAHPIFRILGVFDADVGAGTAFVVVALYAMFAVLALAIDRRALLVSGLAYVLSALVALFRGAGAVELGWSFTALVIGSALLTLSAFWHPMRRAIVSRLGGWGERLPPVALAG